MPHTPRTPNHPPPSGESNWRKNSFGGDSTGGDTGRRGGGGTGGTSDPATTAMADGGAAPSKQRNGAAFISSDPSLTTVVALAQSNIGGGSRPGTATPPAPSAASSTGSLAIEREAKSDAGHELLAGMPPAGVSAASTRGTAGMGGAVGGVGGGERGGSARPTTGGRRSKRKETRPRTASHRPAPTGIGDGNAATVLPSSPPNVRTGRGRPAYRKSSTREGGEGMAVGADPPSVGESSVVGGAGRRPQLPARREKDDTGQGRQVPAQEGDFLMKSDKAAEMSPEPDEEPPPLWLERGSQSHNSTAVDDERLGFVAPRSVNNEGGAAEGGGGGSHQQSSFAGAPARTQQRLRPPPHLDL